MTTRPSLLRAVPAALVRYLTLRLGAGFRLLRCSAAFVLFVKAESRPRSHQSKQKQKQDEPRGGWLK